jgi:branched-subunit amino acid ABC-type transport system permease component
MMAANNSPPCGSAGAGRCSRWLAVILLPFVVGLLEGQSPAAVLSNSAGVSKFVQGLAIEVFIFALYALSYDLIFGITGLLSFGHAMFFAVGAYLTGALIKSFGLPLWQTLIWVSAASVLQALLFGIVLPRVKGITFALVTLGMASVFHIMIMSRELGEFTGADVGLQGMVKPDFLNPATERLRLYYVALALLVVMYYLFKRFVDSPTGRVCVAIRENEGRALMLGYNTFHLQAGGAAALLLHRGAGGVALRHLPADHLAAHRLARLHGDGAADHPHRRRGHAARRAGRRAGLPPARLWAAPLHGRERQLRQRRHLRADRDLPALRHRGDMADAVVSAQAGVG